MYILFIILLINLYYFMNVNDMYMSMYIFILISNICNYDICNFILVKHVFHIKGYLWATSQN